jgi:uncharacterized membrane protein HdeD (DUF308 family)
MSADAPSLLPTAAKLPSEPLIVRSIPRGILVMSMGAIAIAAPFFAGSLTYLLVGSLAIVAGVFELIESLRHPEESKVRSAYMSGEVSIVAGILLLSVPALILRGVAILLAASFFLDGMGKASAAFVARRQGTAWKWLASSALVNLVLATALVARWPVIDWTIVGIVVGIRMIAGGWSLIRGRKVDLSQTVIADDVHADSRLHLPAHPTFKTLNDTLDANENARFSIDVGWCLVFIIVFFAIHIGRMQVYWNLIGMIAPFAAVVGDLAVAMAVAFLVVLPLKLGWRKVTRPIERFAWHRDLARTEDSRPGLFGRLRRWWLTRRLLFSRRVVQMRRTPRSAILWGLKVGLPITAVWISIQSLFGLNYFFNSENWTSIVWHRWAEGRTDLWRAGMIAALQEQHRNIPEKDLFRVGPNISGQEDFSFLVVGDTGDGSYAQQSLRDQYTLLGQRPDMKFLIVSSDVIYPDGAMRDYEHNFYLPFKGFTKPIYAIPGNHDWYDALEGFAANFLDAESARTCMISRVTTDRRLTTTTEARIDGYVDEAARLRREYRIDAGRQRGPFFEIQTERFALVAVDTGVLKTVDNAQWNWFRGALDRCKGKFTMVILGHPLFTAGHYQGDPKALVGEWSSLEYSPLSEEGDIASFTAIHNLLREHEVDVVMAGDMHLFEHYLEPYDARGGTTKKMHHFVNGGGGAYICVGVPFDFPKQPATKVWTYFPSKRSVTEKLDEQTPLWKMPLWLWVKHLSGWPFNGYIMSAAFDHNRSPFFQSFVEIQVRNSTNEVVFYPRGAGGRLRWRELENYQAIIPSGKSDDDYVEFIVPMRPK